MPGSAVIGAAQAGDREAFAELISPLERPLKSYLYCLSASPDKEKEFTHLRDQLSQQRRGLPWVIVLLLWAFPSGRVPGDAHRVRNGTT